MNHPIGVLSEHYTHEELAGFEQLVFASSNPDHAVRLLARAVLASFFNEHGKAKCDLMIAALSKIHDAGQQA